MNNPVISLADAIVEAGATLLNPIFLMTASAVPGSMMIVPDPIFSCLAWGFIFGIIPSTLFSLRAVCFWTHYAKTDSSTFAVMS
ncbi:MAG: hypothetical protein Q7U57_14000 [Methylovulum sp.]|nr:hypothetical protein [Methylovulum sp.]